MSAALAYALRRMPQLLPILNVNFVLKFTKPDDLHTDIADGAHEPKVD
jgi:hypothetical protein